MCHMTIGFGHSFIILEVTYGNVKKYYGQCIQYNAWVNVKLKSRVKTHWLYYTVIQDTEGTVETMMRFMFDSLCKQVY